MQRVFIASPLRAETDEDKARNLRYAQDCMRDSLNRGEAPFLSHLLYPLVLRDDIGTERQSGMQAGAKFMQVCDLVALYTDHGISDGMLEEWKQAERLGIQAVARTLKTLKDD